MGENRKGYRFVTLDPILKFLITDALAPVVAFLVGWGVKRHSDIRQNIYRKQEQIIEHVDSTTKEVVSYLTTPESEEVRQKAQVSILSNSKRLNILVGELAKLIGYRDGVLLEWHNEYYSHISGDHIFGKQTKLLEITDDEIERIFEIQERLIERVQSVS